MSDNIEIELDSAPSDPRFTERKTPPATPIAIVRAAVASQEADLTLGQCRGITRMFINMAAWFTARATERETQQANEAAREAESARAWQANHAAQMAAITAPVVVVQEPTRAPLINRRDIVLGAATVNSGVVTGWNGQGELTHAQTVELLTTSGFPVDWAPSPKSALAHAGFALSLLNASGSVVRADRGGRRRGQRLMSNDGRVRQFSGRWIVGTAAAGTGEVGEGFGRIVVTAVLFMDGRLECAGDPDICARVTADYQRRVNEEIFPAAEITMWLRDLLQYRFRAVRMGGVWYIPHKFAADATRLVAAVANVWGLDWLSPPLPMSTSEQLMAGLAQGLIREARIVLESLETQRAAAREKGASEIGTRAASTIYERLQTVAERAKGYADLLGAHYVDQIRTELRTAMDLVQPLCDDVSLRYAAMDL